MIWVSTITWSNFEKFEVKWHRFGLSMLPNFDRELTFEFRGWARARMARDRRGMSWLGGCLFTCFRKFWSRPMDLVGVYRGGVNSEFMYFICVILNSEFIYFMCYMCKSCNSVFYCYRFLINHEWMNEWMNEFWEVFNLNRFGFNLDRSYIGGRGGLAGRGHRGRRRKLEKLLRKHCE